MYYSFYSQFVLISFSLLEISHRIASQAHEEEAFPEDFRLFLKGLTSMGHGHENKNVETTTMRIVTFKTVRPEVILSSQKSALRDILMMKLVSYYENKYRISQHVMTGKPEPAAPYVFATEASTTKNVVYRRPNYDIFPEDNMVNNELPEPQSRRFNDYGTRKKMAHEFAEIVVI